MDSEPDQEKPSKLPEHLIEKAIRISCYQFVLGSIAGSLAGGMFVTGFALKLDAGNAQIGLMTTIPMFCVVLQLLSSALVERGVSRRLLTTCLAVVWSLVWLLVAAIPCALSKASSNTRITVLIALITLIAAASHLSSNARSSWLADLIPSRRLGEFFGKSMLFSSLVGTFFGVAGGSFLDHAKRGNISGFTWIFIAGATIGLINALLNLPQADVPLSKHEHSNNILKMVREAFKNKALMLVTAFAVVYSLQAIASPFISVYILRDLRVPFVGLGAINAVYAVTVLLSSTFWGRMVDTYGCRPVLVACMMAMVPIPVGWIWITDALSAYCLLAPMNIVAGFAAAGISVALSKLLFDATQEAGKSVQLAVYSIVVYLLTAPLPAIGGHLPDWFRAIGIHADLRCTFYTVPFFTFAAAMIARRIREPDSRATSEFVRDLPKHLSVPGIKGRTK
ncbi:MAG: MFS transporter [Armatimonadota bacterium]|nr:MFS transporter [Armatimonadota bacterium]